MALSEFATAWRWEIVLGKIRLDIANCAADGDSRMELRVEVLNKSRLCENIIFISQYQLFFSAFIVKKNVMYLNLQY